MTKLRIAHLSDPHVGHVTANLIRLSRLLLPKTRGEGAWDIAARLLASSWFERRSLWEPLLRSAHLAHKYQTRSLVAVVQSARENGCDHVILTGDVANLGAASEMREAKLILSAYGYDGSRLTVVPGNHDVVNFQGVAEFQCLMGETRWPHLASISDDVAVLAMDSTAHGDALDWRDTLLMNARGHFSDADIQRANALLSALPKDTFKILCCHHHLVDLPPDGYVDEWSGRIDPRQAGPAQGSAALLDVAQRHAVGLLLFGHRHRATHHLFRIRGIPAACSGSVTELDPLGRLRYRIFDLVDGRITRRRWMYAFPRNASVEVVTQAVRAVSAARQPEDLRLTQPVSLGHIERDVGALIEKSRELDRVVLEKVRRQMRSNSNE